jgi:hypothetical protein
MKLRAPEALRRQATKIDGLPREETQALSSHLKDASEVKARRDAFILEFLKSERAKGKSL